MSTDLPLGDFASRIEQVMLEAAGEFLSSAERHALIRATLDHARAALEQGTVIPADPEVWLTDLAQEQLFAHLLHRQAPYIREVIVTQVGGYVTEQEVNSLVRQTLEQARAHVQQFNPAGDGAQEWLARLAREQMLGYFLQQRNPAALLLLDAHLPQLQRSLYRSTFNDFLQPEDRDDITRNTLLRALHQGERYDPQVAKVATWLNVLLHYETLNFLRATKHISPKTLDAVAHAEADKVEQHLPADTTRPSREMEELLQRLPAKRAQVIRLFFYEGLSYEAIAQQLGVKEVSVRSTVSRGVKQLQEVVNSDERLRQALRKISTLPLVMLFLVMTAVLVSATSVALPSAAHAPVHTPTPARVTAPVPPETAVVAQSIQLSPGIDRTRLLQMEADATAVRESTAVLTRATPEMAHMPPARFTSAEHLEPDAPERAIPTSRLPTPQPPSPTADAGSTVDNRVVPTPNPTHTPMIRATATMTPAPVKSTAADATALPSPVPSATATALVPSATASITASPTVPAPATETAGTTATPTVTAGPQPAATAVPTATAGATALPSAKPSATATVTPTATAGATANATATASATATPTATATASATATATPTATASATATATPTVTASATRTPTASIKPVTGPVTAWSYQDQAERVEIIGVGMSNHAQQLLELPTARRLTVQFGGKLSAEQSEPPETMVR